MTDKQPDNKVERPGSGNLLPRGRDLPNDNQQTPILKVTTEAVKTVAVGYTPRHPLDVEVSSEEDMEAAQAPLDRHLDQNSDSVLKENLDLPVFIGCQWVPGRYRQEYKCRDTEEHAYR